MIVKRAAPCLLAAATLALGACDTVRGALGQQKAPPDEFQVVANAPLSLPPAYTLRPPEPGAPRPQTGTVTDQARQTVFGRPAPQASRSPAASRPTQASLGSFSIGGGLGGAGLGTTGSPGEAAFREKMKLDQADAGIRQEVDREARQLVAESRSFLDRLTFWRKSEDDGSLAINAAREKARLQENAALGKPPTEGEVPVIERRRRAPLEGLF
ncbi:MAG: DUF3035 domain-containing protein [Thalassobaculales bacterium]